MARKLVDFELLVETVNEFLANSSEEGLVGSAQRRQGQIDVLTGLLHRYAVYYGFRYLLQSEVPVGELPGIFINASGTIEGTPIEERFAAGKVDPTRVKFF